jgi:hypothetical protein
MKSLPALAAVACCLLTCAIGLSIALGQNKPIEEAIVEATTQEDVTQENVNQVDATQENALDLEAVEIDAAMLAEIESIRRQVGITLFPESQAFVGTDVATSESLPLEVDFSSALKVVAQENSRSQTALCELLSMDRHENQRLQASLQHSLTALVTHSELLESQADYVAADRLRRLARKIRLEIRELNQTR